MNIAIIDADLIGRKKHRFPNLACMKLSGYYKELGNQVKLITDYKELYINEDIWIEYQNAITEYKKLYEKYMKNPNKIKKDKIETVYNTLCERMKPCFERQNFIYEKLFISKVFTDTEIDEDFISEAMISDGFVEYGGTGFFYDKVSKLDCQIEHHFPDYHLYDDWVNEQIKNGDKPLDLKYYTDYSIGFVTRGCFRQCSFCVNRNYKKVELHSPLAEFHDPTRPKICLLDDNFLGHPEWKRILQELQDTKKPFQFKQGLDERILTEEKCEMLFKSKYDGDYIFAFDNIEDAPLIERKLQLIRKYTEKVPKFYVFCGFDRDDKWNFDFWKQDIVDVFRRIQILMKYNCLPYIMRFNRYEESPFRGTYINLARWSNQPSFFKKKTYKEFCVANGENSSCVEYMKLYEKVNPMAADVFYNIKWIQQ